MFKKELLISALVLAFSFGMVGTAIADPVAHDEAQIAQFENAKAEQAKMAATDWKATSGNNVQADKTESMRLLCVNAPGVISNLDHTTAEQDAKMNCS